MKLNKLACSLPLLIPSAIAPIFLSSCSVYTDLTKEYIPSYKQLSGSLNYEQAINNWFDKASKTENFIHDEMFWSNYQYGTSTFTRTISETEMFKFIYNGKFTVYSSNISYANITNKDEHRFSVKLNSEVEERDEYYLNGEYFGYGTVHYSCEWEMQNLAFNTMIEHDQDLNKDFWLIKPVKFIYDGDEWYWNDWLSNDERVAFNLRAIYEIYDKNGTQTYGFEATEAAIMDKNLSYTSELGYILDNFCCFWSYYLDPCTKA